VRRALLLLGLAVAGCGQRAADSWATQVADRNAEADRLLDRGDRDAAARVLGSVADDVPPKVADPHLVRALLQDARFRLARLALEAKDVGAAVRQAEAGLALGESDDLFTANLLVARGAAREARGETQAALEDYQRALRINHRLLEATLDRR
jgi:tetratricopeptide (TPR) repeat protein